MVENRLSWRRFCGPRPAQPGPREWARERHQGGRDHTEIWAIALAHMARKDMNTRRTVGYSKAKSHADGSKPVNRALPTFGDTSLISIAP
ncbi:hypothetical protein JMK10_02850 [Rhodovulum sulfidophilum]|uniref:hypothetical protein n=1 Tax=Rhodovulum sulfidophilum TaxID=35806 RepID=UPI0019230E2A|nr:hypothetical protein [Rhodovulum sulfidophilum]MBL3575346.1 hypothetical protein [Rhodovulum sulfidophilum]MCE8432638.1 hypothetical protein [Rhodovulum sulfidophilum]MCF4115774.1 hypothetical protein [Rhodovulum sulfidophilum]